MREICLRSLVPAWPAMGCFIANVGGSILSPRKLHPLFSPKHLDFVIEKNVFFAILKILFFKPSQKMHFS